MKGKTQKKVTILWGLPGSGKTFYVNEAYPPASNYGRSPVHIVDCDTVVRISSFPGKPAAKIAEDAVGQMYRHTQIVIDGLITTNQFARDIMVAITTHPNAKQYEILFEIVWFAANRAACLHNDRGRRDGFDSKITIDNLTFEEPSQELIEEWDMKKRVTRKKVVRKPDWQVWGEEIGAISTPRRGSFMPSVADKTKMKSSTWSLGGTSGGYDSSELSRVSPEPQPVSFVEFDELLEKVCPNITFLQYKKIYKETVTTETHGQGDYYGGYTEEACYVCDLPKLYEMLVSLGFVGESKDA